MWELDCEEGWVPKNWCFWTALRVPWTARRSNQSILKEISPEISLEGMMLKLKLQYFGHLMWKVDPLEKTDARRDEGQEENGMTEDEMSGWHHWLNGHESEWTPGVGDGQGGLVCCDSWVRKESDKTERLNWTEFKEQRVGHDWAIELNWTEFKEHSNSNQMLRPLSHPFWHVVKHQVVNIADNWN